MIYIIVGCAEFIGFHLNNNLLKIMKNIKLRFTSTDQGINKTIKIYNLKGY